MSTFDNDTVTVDVNGILVDVTGATSDRGSIVVKLDPEELTSAIKHHAGQPDKD
ncbi:hypothetical protein ACTOB_001266 [Actinoplanes oblitus]|uniref:Uncharacterized protein n=1 Tax=Actinoplanes oblitus TaxID=3040509 RepID=A0ABY8WJA7_9ACTN|nr:hypothetical protein [Actinoplanes oblitus]WIM97718.1 hypothetical protein ACTOB_001266 [Actinoplanes oblitus]